MPPDRPSFPFFQPCGRGSPATLFGVGWTAKLGMPVLGDDQKLSLRSVWVLTSWAGILCGHRPWQHPGRPVPGPRHPPFPGTGGP